MCVNYSDNGIAAFINKLLSQRLKFSNQAFKEFGTTLLGQQIYVTATERTIAGLGEEIIIDNAYINILMRSGIIVLILYLAGYILGMIRLAIERDYSSFIILLILFFYGSIELMVYLPMWNIFLIFLVSNFRKNGKEDTLISHAKRMLSPAK